MLLVWADYSPSFLGAPSILPQPFGAFRSVVHATLNRLVPLADALGPIVVCYRDPAKDGDCETPDVPAVRWLRAPPSSSPLDLFARVAHEQGAKALVLVDPRSVFISPSLLKKEYLLHLRSDCDLTLCTEAADGLAAPVLSVGALATVGRHLQWAHESSALGLDWTTLVREFPTGLRTQYVKVDAHPRCNAADLLPRDVQTLRALEPYALPSESEDYERVLDAACERAWMPRIRPAVPPARRPRVLLAHYTTSLEPGSTRAVRTLVDHWNHERHDLSIALPNDGALYARIPDRAPVTLLPLQWAGTPDTLGDSGLRQSLAIGSFLDELKPDVVLVSGSVPALAVAARARGIPSICYMQWPLVNMPPDVATRARMQFYDLVIGSSQWTTSDLRSWLRPPPGRLRFVQYGIPLQDFLANRTSKTEARQRLDVPEAAKIIACVGMFTPMKRHWLALEIVACVARSCPDVQLLLLGGERFSGQEVARLKQRAAELGIERSVRFMGFVEDMPLAYAACDLLLHCASGEPFGLVLAEAMAAGLPVVATGSHGPAEIVLDRVTGRLVPPAATPAEWAEEVNRLFEQPQLAAEMGRRGRERAQAEFSAEAYASRIQTVCDEAMGLV